MPSKQDLQIKNQLVKGLTFADAYGLGLLARSPSSAERIEIIEHLSPSGKKLAGVVVSQRPAIKARKKGKTALKK
jgi:hypothetical protein